MPVKKNRDTDQPALSDGSSFVPEVTESDSKYRALFNAIDEGFCIIQVLFDGNKKPIDYRFLEINPAFEKQSGLHDAQGKRIRELEPRTEEHWFETFGHIALTGEPKRFENEFDNRWYDVYAFRIGSPHERKVAVLFKDASKHREALWEREERFRIMADGSPIMIWVTGPDGGNQFINRAYREFCGVSLEQVEGFNWRLLVHPEDSEEYVGRFLASLREQKPFHAEVRVLSADGEWRWIESFAAPRFSPSGEFLGMVGSSPDITDRKKAEEEVRLHRDHLEELVAERTKELRNLTHRLVDAQEEERAAIGSELHDEIGQLLTYITFLIGAAERDPKRETFAEAMSTVRECVSKVRNLSSALSPSLLRSTSLLPALTSVVEEYAKRTDIQVHFRHPDTLDGVPDEVALAGYRIIQEALTNVARHSKAAEVTVRLSREADRLLLEIADSGIGFDPVTVQKSTGLTGMRERALALGGELSIESNPGQGTKIAAALPCPS